MIQCGTFERKHQSFNWKERRNSCHVDRRSTHHAHLRNFAECRPIPNDKGSSQSKQSQQTNFRIMLSVELLRSRGRSPRSLFGHLSTTLRRAVLSTTRTKTETVALWRRRTCNTNSTHGKFPLAPISVPMDSEDQYCISQSRYGRHRGQQLATRSSQIKPETRVTNFATVRISNERAKLSSTIPYLLQSLYC